ncbi:hypothetical protein JOF41_006601 [Saccharothrix coeruleofusca]|uniref:hypothetical protein n=1 Tax=Saccharothrix coeruleofusca TaxID=33919 RepID=UPI001AE64A75|nr:hypothetical protein [Saccharothrix coeruleofusca]MBP2340423.1 hypothetical protein [Saccharothrix coeruleofusca]
MSAPTVTTHISDQLAEGEPVMTAPAVPIATVTAVASIDGVAVPEFTPSTRDGLAEQPATLATLSLSLPLSREELVAALFYWNSSDSAELVDDEYVRQLVVESVVNVGMGELTALCFEIDTAPLDDVTAEWLAYCRRRVAEVFPAAVSVPEQRGRTDYPQHSAGRPAEVVEAALAGASLRQVAVALYFSDYRPGDLARSGLEWVETCAAIGLDGLTAEVVNRVHAAPDDLDRFTDCRAAARVVLDAR